LTELSEDVEAYGLETTVINNMTKIKEEIEEGEKMGLSFK